MPEQTETSRIRLLLKKVDSLRFYSPFKYIVSELFAFSLTFAGLLLFYFVL